VAAFMLTQFLLALAMAASPELHHYFHHDSDDDDHECVVTHLINGDFSDGIPVQTITVQPATVRPQTQPVEELNSAWVAPLYLQSCVQERAPPAA
jgi:hypothetical protein